MEPESKLEIPDKDNRPWPGHKLNGRDSRQLTAS